MSIQSTGQVKDEKKKPKSRDRQRAAQAPISSNAEYLNAAQVCERYGGVSYQWIERRLADPKSGFPRPYKFGKRAWKLAELFAWEATRKA